MSDHDKHYVTTKAAIYSTDNTHVLVNRLHFKDYRQYGLPGGHIDEGETPDMAITRELDEELGIKVNNVMHKDFFTHENGKIVLGFTASMSCATPLLPSNPDVETGEWLTKKQFTDISIDTGYKKFVLSNWPG